jgi:hypothetical protein
MSETSDISDVFHNVIDSNKVERDMQISLRNLRKLDCAGKPVSTFPHPALERLSLGCFHPSDKKSLQFNRLEHILVVQMIPSERDML